MNKDKNSIEQLRVDLGLLLQEVLSSKRMLEDLQNHQSNHQKPVFLSRLMVKSNKRFIIVQIGDISWIEAWGDYIRLHCKGKFYIIRQKISEIESRLDPQRFLRIGRSAIVNIDHMKELEPLNHGDYLVTLHENTQLNLSRNYRDCLSAVFNNHL